MTDIDPAALEALRAWDTPTICNALEVVVPHRRATGFTVEHLHCLDPALMPMVGYARTATIRAVEPSPLRPTRSRPGGPRTTSMWRRGRVRRWW